MKRFVLFLVMVLLAVHSSIPEDTPRNLEPYTYTEDFESCELNAWASYPLWQDTAYDPNFRVDTIVPGDPNISIVQRVTPYTNVDNFAGAQKKLDAFLVAGSSVRLRYYLKTHLKPEYFKVRIAAGEEGKIDVTIPYPQTNRWVWVTATYEDFLRENPRLEGKRIKVNALAVLAKLPEADPAMPIFLGLDDITLKGARAAHFQFTEPEMLKLSEWKPYIPRRHYRQGSLFKLRGRWPFKAGRVTCRIMPFIDRSKTVLEKNLEKRGEEWRIEELKLSLPEGLYLAQLNAFEAEEKLSETEFTLYIAPQGLEKKHPRLWFDSKKAMWLKERLRSERYKKVAEDILKKAREAREKYPVEKIAFDIDQFPEDETLIGNVPRSIYPWFNRINAWQDSILSNSLAYALLDDREAGEYARALMKKLSDFPFWVHPWFEKRGSHIYYPVGEFGMDMALGYDLVYDLMDDEERELIRKAMRKQIVEACHKSYVEDNLCTSNTSNWVAHITGGSLMCQAAIYGDRADAEEIEPYFTGVMLKMHEFIEKAFNPDGSYGESYGYYNFTMLSLSKSLPAVENVFKIDMSGTIHGSYRELIWAGLIKNKKFFFFGDSGGDLSPLANWAWLLPKYRDPLLGWAYLFLKEDETLMDVLYDTEDVPRKDPFGENPVAVFRDVGTTVFRSGWEGEDFVFVMRTGAFYNHQHLDQGTFWLADRGNIFIEERHGSTYYDDPYYQSHYTQPVAHSTILVDGNEQSQRVGDPLRFAQGFDDHAFIYHFLDGSEAAFASGDIGRLYWGKVKEMRRNVLFLKPRTILMLETIIPAERDVEVTLLYQTTRLQDIQAEKDTSFITKGQKILHIKHLSPVELTVKRVETPLYINTLKSDMPLIKEGMLTVIARTRGEPLVMANLLTTTVGEGADVSSTKGEGFITGKAEEKEFAFSTRPGHVYSTEGISTDALALTWSGGKIFACLSTILKRGDKMLIQSDEPLTCELSKESLSYYLANSSLVSIGLDSKPQKVMVNESRIKEVTYDKKRRLLILTLPAGKGYVSFR